MQNTKKILSILVKLGLFVVMIYFIYYQLEAKGINYKEALSRDGIKHSENYLLLFGAFFLGLLNWSLESFKWKTLVNTIQKKFTYQNAVSGVLMGVFLGFITPNRIGEFGGRLFKIEPGHKIQALSLAFRGGLVQFVTTFTIGLISTIFVGLICKLVECPSFISETVLYTLLFIMTIILILIYYNFNVVVNYISKISILSKLIKFDYVNIDVSKRILTRVFLITVLRYFVYMHQYILLAYFFSIEVHYLYLFSAVSTMLLIQTLGPSFPLIDLPYRGLILIELLSDYTDNQLNILFVILLVWILNLVLPAIIGYLNFVNLKMELNNESSDLDIINKDSTK